MARSPRTTKATRVDVAECIIQHDWQKFLPLDETPMLDVGFCVWWECTRCGSQKEVVCDAFGHWHHTNRYYSDEYKERERMTRATARAVWARSQGIKGVHNDAVKPIDKPRRKRGAA